VVWFTAPRRGWLLDFRLTGGHSHATDRFSDSVTVDGFTSDLNVNARMGRRFYQGRGKSLVSFQTLGAIAGYTHGCQGGESYTDFCRNGWTAGVFAELGGAYLITQRFSIGGTGSVSFSYDRSTTRSPSFGVSKRWAYQGSAQGFGFVATIYF
jgi:hypothetical protein